jgi:hypothetical protein
MRGCCGLNPLTMHETVQECIVFEGLELALERKADTPICWDC